MSHVAPEQLEKLRALAQEKTSPEPAHDWLHVLRVESAARQIARAEDADESIATLAALLHEVFSYPKHHPLSHESGRVCAKMAAELMQKVGLDTCLIGPIAYCIEVHPFSAGIEPTTLEAKVLQDADRLDALGAIGIARCFATCAQTQGAFYNPGDPFCERREPQDKLFGIDHFYKKLFRVPERLHTSEAKRIATQRVQFMRQYIEQLRSEI